MRGPAASFSLKELGVQSLVCLLVVACPGNLAVAQQEARFDVDRRYEASSSRSYDAATPELYVPAARPRTGSGHNAVPRRSAERTGSSMIHSQSELSLLKRQAGSAPAPPLRLGEMTSFPNLGSSMRSDKYVTRLPQKETSFSTYRPAPAALKEAHAQHAALTSITGRPGLPLSHTHVADEPGFSKRHRAPSDPASRITTSAP